MRIIQGIYKITNKANSKFYIGSSKNIENRWKEHIRVLNRKVHHSKKLQRAWDKYGEENFIFEVIEEVEDLNNLFKYEQKWFDKTKCYDSKYGYNICDIVGDDSLKYKHLDKKLKKVKKENKIKKYKDDIKKIIELCERTAKSHNKIKVKFKIREKDLNTVVYNKQMYTYKLFLKYYNIFVTEVYPLYKDLIIGDVNIEVELGLYANNSFIKGKYHPTFNLKFDLINDEYIYSIITDYCIKKKMEKDGIIIEEAINRLMKENNLCSNFNRLKKVVK